MQFNNGHFDREMCRYFELRRARVRAAFRAAALRAEVPRRMAAACACLDKARRVALLRPSRFSALRTAVDLFADGDR